MKKSKYAICEARSAYHARISAKLSVSSKCPTQWWKTVNDVLEKNYKPSIPALEKDGKTLISPIYKANALNKFVTDQTDLKIPLNHFSSLGSPQIPSITLSKVKVKRKKVLRLLLKLNASKATGSDKIPALFLKMVAHQIYKPLTKILQRSLNLGVFPSEWKIADVVSIHKKKSRSDPGNYRPISLLPIISKLFESIVADKLKVFIAPMLKLHQFGFRSIWAYHNRFATTVVSAMDCMTL